MENYVVGFAISRDHQKVVLIEKNRPSWQKGFLNGVGGHIEKNESPAQAMVREFYEEAGMRNYSWENYITLLYPGSIIYFFRLFVSEYFLEGITSKTDEPMGIYNIKDLQTLKVIPNLRWLIPLALDNIDPNLIKFQILYQHD